MSFLTDGVKFISWPVFFTGNISRDESKEEEEKEETRSHESTLHFSGASDDETKNWGEQEESSSASEGKKHL